MLWLAIKKACNAYNVKTNFTDFVSPATIGMWYTEIETVRDQIDAWRESPDMMAHKAWVDNLRMSNFAAAKAWLEVKDKETFWPKEDTQARVIIEFAMPPSPFAAKGATPSQVVSVPIKEPIEQSKNFHVTQTKKKKRETLKSLREGWRKTEDYKRYRQETWNSNRRRYRQKIRLKKKITLQLHELRDRMNEHRP